jgi:Fe-S-cluster-containing hydrogenase component 2
MGKLETHPSVIRYRARRPEELTGTANDGPLDEHWLRRVCEEAGIDDVGFVAIDRSELDDQRADILAAFPATRSLISFVCRMNKEPVRSPARSVSNREFHASVHHADEVARNIVRALEQAGVPAMNSSAGFPMEMNRYPGRIWVVSHKPVAVAAGLGQMGIHRCVIHPVFGSFITIGTVLVGRDIATQSLPVSYNPCVECKLCVAACPVGAIGSDGYFNFSACVTHNYREFMGGFTDWVATIADSRDGADYRRRVPASESASMWQSLSFEANYKAAYCIASCPAGDDVIGPFLDDRKTFLERVVNPLQSKAEPIYVVPGSDAEQHVAKRFPHKTIRPARGLRATSIQGFLFGLRLTFQREASRGVEATYHFTFTGREPVDATVVIRDRTITVQPGHVGEPQVRIRADSVTWLGFVAKEKNLLWAILRGKIRVRGSLRLMAAFGRCFPS